MWVLKVESLKRTLKGLHSGEVSEEEALRVIKDATPLEISKAEQSLLDEGISESELKDFCKVHLQAVQDRIDKIKSRLGDSHPIKILISEHDDILGFLDVLEEIGDRIPSGLSEEDKGKLKKVAKNLVESEKHHEREEEVIFPRLEERGIDGPPRIMKQDHNEFRPRKKKLLELSKNPEKNKEEIVELIDFLTYNLRDHIFKENNILYPTALDELEDWDVIGEEGERIGLCSFSNI